MNRKRGGINTQERTNAFSSLIRKGKIREGVRFICERESGGIMQRGDIDSKIGDLVKETLKSKHPNGRDVSVENLPEFESCLEIIDIVVREDNVEKVAKQLSGSTGPSGINSFSMSHWLLKFGPSSAILRKSFADVTEWLANSYPPWMAYRAMTSCRFLALDKVFKCQTNRNRKHHDTVSVQNAVDCSG